jgi:hypothetical protein
MQERTKQRPVVIFNYKLKVTIKYTSTDHKNKREREKEKKHVVSLRLLEKENFIEENC